MKGMRKQMFFLLLIKCLVSFAQVIENPVFDRSDIPSMHINKVVITPDTTFVYCTYTAEANSWANISGDTYLMSYPSKEKHKLLSSSGLPIAPEERDFPLNEKCEVLFCFSSISGSDYFDFIENPKEKAFNIYGVSLSESNDAVFADYSIEQAKALKTKADFYATIKNYEKAIEYEIQAMPIIRFWYGRLNEFYENSTFMLGIYNSKIKKYKKAEAYFKESLKISSLLHGEEDELYTTKLTTLASNYKNLGDYFTAINLYEKSIANQLKSTKVKDLQYARTQFLLALTYQEIGDVDNALRCSKDVFSIFESIKEEYDEEYLYASLVLASLYAYTDLQKSKEMALGLLPIIKQNYGVENDMYLSTLITISNCSMILNDAQEALSYANEAKNISEQIFGQNGIQYGAALSLLSQIYAIDKNYKKAISFEIESIDAMRSELSDFSYALRLGSLANYYAKNKDCKNALRYVRNSTDILRQIVNRDFENTEVDQKYAMWTKFYRSVESHYPQYVANCASPYEVGNLYNDILFFKGITARNYNKNACTWKEVQKSLKEGEIAIEFVESLEKDSINTYYAMTIKKGYENPKLFRLIDLKQFGDIFQGPLSFAEQKILLGNHIWGILKNELWGVDNIYFSPVGLFHQIAIENLPYDEKEYYSDKYNMFRLSSTRELVVIKGCPEYKSAYLYGGLDYNNQVISSNNTPNMRSGFDYLYNTNDEVFSIADILKERGINSTLYSGEEGTEESFKSLSGKDFNILHMATHGMSVKKEDVEKLKTNNNFQFLANKSLISLEHASDVLSWSFLVLSGGNKLINRIPMLRNDDDGIITAIEVANMDFHNIDLVVLSACESGLGPNATDNTVMGLQRGFKDAGVNTILMSISRVDDKATKILMVEFYRNLMSGKTKHQSLKDAQNHLRQIDNGIYDKPECWASFIMLDGLK